MRLWNLAPFVLLLILGRGLSCAPTPPQVPTHACTTPNDNPNPFGGGGSTRNPAIVELCTDSPTPTSTPLPTPTPNSSVTPISNNSGAWYHKIGTYTHQLRRAGDAAATAYPDYATNPDSTNGFATSFGEAGGLPTSGIDALRPPPSGLETQYTALDTKLHTFLTVVRTYPLDAAAIVAAQNDYVAACTGLQQYADTNSIDVDLRCSGTIAPLGAADFFDVVAPSIATMHTNADATQATFDALSPAQQADISALSVYVGGIGFAYGTAAQSVVDPAAPIAAAAAQQAFVDAANAITPAVQQLEEQMKETSDPAGLPAIVASVSGTLTPLRAAVEGACAQLQSAATSAGVTRDLGCRN